MAVKKTRNKKSNLKKDTLKQEENVFTMVKNGFKSPQFPLVAGVFLFMFAVFCLIAFVSYFYTCIADYDSVKNLSPYDLLSGQQDIGNWGGNLGAFLSYYIITHTFGVGALGFVLILGLFALKLFKVKIPVFSKWLVSTFVIMLWLSCIMGFIVVVLDVQNLESFAGIVGVGINQGLSGLLGKIGTAIILLAFTVIVPMLLFDVRYIWVRQTVKTLASHGKTDKLPQEEKEPELKEDIQPKEPHSTLKSKIKQSLKHNTSEENAEEQTDNLSKQERKQVDELLKRAEAEDKYDNSADTHDDLPADLQQSAEQTDTASTDSISMPVGDNDVTDQQNDYYETEQDQMSDIPFTVKQQETEDVQEDDTANEEINQPHYHIDQPYNPYETLSHYQFPTTDILIDYDKNNTVITDKELLANKNRIVATLQNYKIEISSIEATVGPTVTLYEIVPAPGIRISKIKSLEDDIALSLSALGIRIIAPIPGKGTIGIEVPNSKPQVVSVKSMLESSQFTDNKFELPVAIGKRIDNTPYVADLAKMPHLLMAGATGQGKSVGLNAIISSLLYKKHPCDLKFIFVDPKKVELSLYSKLEKHYLAKVPNGKEAVITDVKDVVYTLRSLCQLMDTRYELLKEAGCKKITEYNKKFIARRLNPERGHEYMPYIVLVIDEFADLIMTAGKEIEKPICRLAQLARAVGIHLIIATQRPSVNIITGTIKANFPARAAFKVSSLTDSRTILDTKGAEQLIGRGDMLVSNGGPLVRLQCALIDTEEIEQVADFIAAQQGFSECFLLPEVKEDADEEGGEKKSFDDGKLDSKFEEAARLIVMTQQGSTSMLQRKLALGYNRAGRVMDQLESAGIVGPFRGSKARDVLVTTEEELNEIISSVLNKQG